MHIKLTETDYIDPETVAHIVQRPWAGGLCVDVFFKSRHIETFSIHGEEADVAWANWKAYMSQAKQ